MFTYNLNTLLSAYAQGSLELSYNYDRVLAKINMSSVDLDAGGSGASTVLNRFFAGQAVDSVLGIYRLVVVPKMTLRLWYTGLQTYAEQSISWYENNTWRGIQFEPNRLTAINVIVNLSYFKQFDGIPSEGEQFPGVTLLRQATILDLTPAGRPTYMDMQEVAVDSLPPSNLISIAAGDRTADEFVVGSLKSEPTVQYDVYGQIEYEVLPGDFTLDGVDTCPFRQEVTNLGRCVYWNGQCALPHGNSLCGGWITSCVKKRSRSVCPGWAMSKNCRNVDGHLEITQDNFFWVFDRLHGAGIVPYGLSSGQVDVTLSHLPFFWADEISCYMYDASWKGRKAIPCYAGVFKMDYAKSLMSHPFWRWVKADGSVDFLSLDRDAVTIHLKERDVPHAMESVSDSSFSSEFFNHDKFLRAAAGYIGPAWYVPDWWIPGVYEVWIYGRNDLLSTLRLRVRTVSHSFFGMPKESLQSYNYAALVPQNLVTGWWKAATLYIGSSMSGRGVLCFNVEYADSQLISEKAGERHFEMQSMVLQRLS